MKKLVEGCGGMSGKVVKAERALYGPRQSGREWGFEAAESLIENGYEQSMLIHAFSARRWTGRSWVRS